MPCTLVLIDGTLFVVVIVVSTLAGTVTVIWYGIHPSSGCIVIHGFLHFCRAAWRIFVFAAWYCCGIVARNVSLLRT